LIVARDLDGLRRAAAPAPLAFVPTMGKLHAGHLALVELARRHAPRVALGAARLGNTRLIDSAEF
jgi:pantothenate synthetase